MSDIYKLDPRNARTHPEKNKEAVRKSLAELGAGRSIVVDADGVVIGGNAVYEQAKELGIPIKEIKTKGDELVVVRRVDLKTDDPRRKALALADNRIAELAEWDEAVLEELQTELLGEVEFDVMGFDDPVEPLDEDETAVGEMVDRAEELNEKWQVKRGQIWEIPSKSVPGKAHRVMCGDSTDKRDVALLMKGDAVGLVFTSPPYAQQRDYGESVDVSNWDGLMQGVFSCLPVSEGAQVLVNLGLIYKGGEWVPYWNKWIEWMSTHGWRRFGWYVWDQGSGLMGNWNGRLAPSHEWIFHFNKTSEQPVKWVDKKPHSITLARGTMRESSGKTKAMSSPLSGLQKTKIPDSVLRIKRQVGSDGHPAQYPIELPQAVIRTWPHSVFDPFLGSGTTVIAAEREGHICYGMEIEPKYVAVTLERLSALGLEPVMGDD